MKEQCITKQNNFFESIQVDMYSSTPKYLQLAHSILEAIETGKIQKNLLLPSLNELTYNLEISRETADKGYKYLQQLGVLQAIPGKGHYVTSDIFRQELKICLLVNKLSDEKKLFYDTFTEKVGTHVPVDFYIYNNDFLLFKKFFSRNKDYSHYVILPHFKDGADEAELLINSIPKEKLIIVDKNLTGIRGKYGCVYENFKKDIYKALEKALPRLSRYSTLKLIFPNNSYFPEDIIQGFNSFCLQYAFERKVIDYPDPAEISGNEVFICLKEDDLVLLIEIAAEMNMKVGKDIGVISYNETPMKKFILSGITTISTDYQEMGIRVADMIINNYREKVELPFRLNLRPSL